MNRVFITITLLISLVSLASNALAVTAEQPLGYESHSDEKEKKIEAWGLGGLGMARTAYSEVTRYPQDGGSGMSFDLGLYWTATEGDRLIGAAFNTVGDEYLIQSSAVGIRQWSVSASFLDFMSDKIGEGIFLRGDAGLAAVTRYTGTWEFAHGTTTRPGLHLRGGAGYGFALGDSTKLLASGDASYRYADGSNFFSFGLMAGVLF